MHFHQLISYSLLECLCMLCHEIASHTEERKICYMLLVSPNKLLQNRVIYHVLTSAFKWGRRDLSMYIFLPLQLETKLLFLILAYSWYGLPLTANQFKCSTTNDCVSTGRSVVQWTFLVEGKVSFFAALHNGSFDGEFICGYFDRNRIHSSLYFRTKLLCIT
jgi:hypothetical protein